MLSRSWRRSFLDDGDDVLPLCLAISSLTAFCFIAYALTSTNHSDSIIFTNSPITASNIAVSNGSSLINVSNELPYLLPVVACAGVFALAGLATKIIKSTSHDDSQNAVKEEQSAHSGASYNNKVFNLALCLGSSLLGYFSANCRAGYLNILPLSLGAISCGIIGAGLNGLLTGKYNFFIGNNIQPKINCGSASQIVNIYLGCNSVLSEITSVCRKVAEVSFFSSEITVENKHTQVG